MVFREIIPLCSKQDWHCTHNVMLRCVRLTTLAVEKQYYIFWVRVYRLSYAASNALAPYRIVIYGLYDSVILFHIISQTVRLSKNELFYTNVCFDFLYDFRPKHFSF
jgi:hypothetical protein